MTLDRSSVATGQAKGQARSWTERPSLTFLVFYFILFYFISFQSTKEGTKGARGRGRPWGAAAHLIVSPPPAARLWLGPEDESKGHKGQGERAKAKALLRKWVDARGKQLPVFGGLLGPRAKGKALPFGLSLTASSIFFFFSSGFFNFSLLAEEEATVLAGISRPYLTNWLLRF